MKKLLILLSLTALLAGCTPIDTSTTDTGNKVTDEKVTPEDVQEVVVSNFFGKVINMYTKYSGSRSLFYLTLDKKDGSREVVSLDETDFALLGIGDFVEVTKRERKGAFGLTLTDNFVVRSKDTFDTYKEEEEHVSY